MDVYLAEQSKLSGQKLEYAIAQGGDTVFFVVGFKEALMNFNELDIIFMICLFSLLSHGGLDSLVENPFP